MKINLPWYKAVRITFYYATPCSLFIVTNGCSTESVCFPQNSGTHKPHLTLSPILSCLSFQGLLVEGINVATTTHKRRQDWRLQPALLAGETWLECADYMRVCISAYLRTMPWSYSGERRYTTILDFGTRYRSASRPSHFTFGERVPGSNWKEVVWALEPVWTLWITDYPVALVRNRTPDVKLVARCSIHWTIVAKDNALHSTVRTWFLGRYIKLEYLPKWQSYRHNQY